MLSRAMDLGGRERAAALLHLGNMLEQAAPVISKGPLLFEKRRWQDDLHRFPPYQFRDINCLVNSRGDFQPPNIAEREAILGSQLAAQNSA